jgi:small-conductance mechanosensitive channel
MSNLDAAFRNVIARLDWLPNWVSSLLLIGGATLLVLALHGFLTRRLQHLVSKRGLFWRSLVRRTFGPGRLALVIAAVSLVSTVAPIPPEWQAGMRHVLLVATIALVGWIAVTAIHIATIIYLRRFKLDAEDNLLARKHVTQMRILQRAGVTLVVLVTTAIALMTFGPVRQYGVSLLASAGAAGLILGLAMQPVLSNLVAGIQIAITQPIRIEDAIIVEGEWGWVEEITATYVVVRLWDWRRLVLPLTYFIQKPFQNWTRDGASLIGSVFLYLDHTAPIDAMRRKLNEIAEASPLWDKRVVTLQVTDAKEAVIEVRILVSARNAPQAWDLRCEVREKMIAWLREAHRDALPRRRAEVVRDTLSLHGQDAMPAVAAA